MTHSDLKAFQILVELLDQLQLQPYTARCPSANERLEPNTPHWYHLLQVLTDRLKRITWTIGSEQKWAVRPCQELIEPTPQWFISPFQPDVMMIRGPATITGWDLYRMHSFFKGMSNKETGLYTFVRKSTISKCPFSEAKRRASSPFA
jgi:hypothetical protein